MTFALGWTRWRRSGAKVRQHAGSWLLACRLGRTYRSAPMGSARGRAEIARFFDGFELVDPGLVEVWSGSTPSPSTRTFYAQQYYRPITVIPGKCDVLTFTTARLATPR